MRIPAIALCLLAALAGCRSAAIAPVGTDPGTPTGSVDLYQARLSVGLGMPRQVQNLPDFWDHADLKVESKRLKAPATSSMAIATASLAPNLTLPSGPATVSIELRAQGILMATGSATASLVAGLNPVNVTMLPLLNQVATLAGNGTGGGMDGVGPNARFNSPSGLAMDPQGNLFVADTSNHKIRRITPGGVVSTVAGSGTAGWADGTGAAAQFNGPSGVVVDPGGNLFVADTNNNRIRKIDPAGTVTTLAGSGATGSVDATGTAATFWSPTGITLDASGSLYVSDFDGNHIRKITVPSGAVTTFTNYSWQGPSGLAMDPVGNLFVANYFASTIQKVSPGGTVMTFAGTGLGFMGDGGPANAAKFNEPQAVAVDGTGNVYVADTFNYRIRKIDTAGNVSTIAGSGTNGMSDGPAPLAKFGAMFGIVARGSGSRIYVSDWANQRIRVLVNP